MAGPMDADRFWALVADGVTRCDDGSVDASGLPDTLGTLSLDDLGAFDRRCGACFAMSRTWAMWGAAWLIHDGAPDDTFDYFRSWLIGAGRHVFEEALRDPDTLADAATPESLDDEIYNAAERVYRARTGDDPPWEAAPWPELDQSIDFNNDEQMQCRYPRLYARFRDPTS